MRLPRVCPCGCNRTVAAPRAEALTWTGWGGIVAFFLAGLLCLFLGIACVPLDDVVEEFAARLTPQQRRYLALRLAGYGSSDASTHLGITKQAGSCLLQHIRTRYEEWRAETG